MEEKKNFEYFNPNPSYHPFSNGKNKNWTVDDSSVRALCAVTGSNWETSFNKLHQVALSILDMPHSKETMLSIMNEYGFEYLALGKPAKGTKRITVGEFVQENPNGKFVLNLAGRFVGVVDGKIKDVEDLSDAVVYSYWKK